MCEVFPLNPLRDQIALRRPTKTTLGQKESLTNVCFSGVQPFDTNQSHIKTLLRKYFDELASLVAQMIEKRPAIESAFFSIGQEM